ncbi:hypothetical protein FN846DRAFT_774142, partial [Sphaerosporella brunnea]
EHYQRAVDTIPPKSASVLWRFSVCFGLSTRSARERGREGEKRTLQLGRTIRILHERMPTLLQSPLPSEILSPHITLHLFPSTHPHLPVVKGRVAYIAALWTAPIAWKRLPGGNTELEVLSERMLEGEKLRVRWQAKGEDEFSGVFWFEFDEEGRIVKHVIENMEEDDDKVAGFITVTEWLMRKARGEPMGGGLAWNCERVPVGKK